jgi:rubrerythrin
MKNLNGTKTHTNLKDAFAGESQANRRYLYFANKADVEGQNDVAAVFRSTAEGETGHAHGHLDYLRKSATRQRGCPSAPRGPISRRRSPARRTSTPTCIRVWPRRAQRRIRRDCRLVRDAGESRAVARESLPEGAGRVVGLRPSRAAASLEGAARNVTSVRRRVARRLRRGIENGLVGADA